MVLALCAVLAAADARAQETAEALPDGPGRDETFRACIACHGTALVRRSRLTREG